LRVRGEGIAKIEVRPDAEFYNPAKHLSWWGQGEDSAGKVSVLKRDGSWTDWLTPSQSGDGIDFAHDGGVRKFEVQATGGSVSFFLGEGIGKL
jgi:hypothetical protein